MNRFSLFGIKLPLSVVLVLLTGLLSLGCEDTGSGLTAGDNDSQGDTEQESTNVDDCRDNGDCSNCEYCNAAFQCEIVVNCGTGTGFECETNDDCEATQFCAANNRCKTLDVSNDCEDRNIVSSVGNELNFGYVMLGREIEKTVSISNDGTCPLTVGEASFAIPESSSEFSLRDLPTFPIVVEPGGSFGFKVVYEGVNPTGDRKSKLMQIASNDPDTPVYRITVVVDIGGTTNLEVRTCTGEALTERRISMGNTQPGTPLVECLEICNNMPESGKNRPIMIEQIALDDMLNFQFEPTEDISVRNGYYLLPGLDNCLEMMLIYSPATQTVYLEDHHTRIVIFAEADQHFGEVTEESSMTLYVNGSANDSTLLVVPNPINFGQVVVTDPVAIKTIDVTNRAGRDIKLDLIELSPPCVPDSDQRCCDFAVNASNAPMGQLVGDEESFNFLVAYSPSTYAEDNSCNVVIKYTQVSSNSEVVPLRAKGVPPNTLPIARLALGQNEAPIEFPLEYDEPFDQDDNPITFWATISEDPDGNSDNLDFKWSLIRPDQSNATLGSVTEDVFAPSPNVVRLKPDMVGTYVVGLQVRDEQGGESEWEHVEVIVGGNDTIKVEMQFSGNGTMNVSLSWEAPNGQICDDQHMSAGSTCDLGDDFGSAYVSAYTTQASQGTRESIVHPSAGSGNYRITVTFIEDCAGWEFELFGIPICLERHDTEVNLRIYLNNEPYPHWPSFEFDLNDIGDTKEFSITRTSLGVWNEPVPIP